MHPPLESRKHQKLHSLNSLGFEHESRFLNLKTKMQKDPKLITKQTIVAFSQTGGVQNGILQKDTYLED